MMRGKKKVKIVNKGTKGIAWDILREWDYFEIFYGVNWEMEDNEIIWGD